MKNTCPFTGGKGPVMGAGIPKPGVPIVGIPGVGKIGIFICMWSVGGTIVGGTLGIGPGVVFEARIFLVK